MAELGHRSPRTGLTAIEELAFALQIKPPREGVEGPRERRYQTQRDLVVALLTKLVAKHAHITKASNEKLAFTEVICIHTPVGALAWGLAPDRLPWYRHLKRSHCSDHHTASERDARLRRLLLLPATKLLAWLSGPSLAPKSTRKRRSS